MRIKSPSPHEVQQSGAVRSSCESIRLLSFIAIARKTQIAPRWAGSASGCASEVIPHPKQGARQTQLVRQDIEQWHSRTRHNGVQLFVNAQVMGCMRFSNPSLAGSQTWLAFFPE